MHSISKIAMLNLTDCNWNNDIRVDSIVCYWNKPAKWNDLEEHMPFQLGALPVYSKNSSNDKSDIARSKYGYGDRKKHEIITLRM